LVASLALAILLSASNVRAVGTAYEYAISEVDDAGLVLESDAATLGLDLSLADYSDDESGWESYATDEYEIARFRGSGYFMFLNKKTESGEVERGAETINSEQIEDCALTLLEELKLPFEQIHSVEVHLISAQGEDVEGNNDGPIMTVGFLVYIHRQIDGFPVYGSNAKVVYNHKGQLHQISMSWRNIDVEPLDRRSILDEGLLWEEGAYEIYGENSPAQDQVDSIHAVYAYEEAPYYLQQDTFELRYVFSYVYDHESFVMNHSVAATE